MTDRQAYIDYLIFFTNKTEAYFEKMTDEDVESEYRRLIEANEDNKQCGWTLCPSFLTKIQSHLNDSEDCPSLEQIEMTLLAFKKMMKCD